MDYLNQIRLKGRDANPFFVLMGIQLGSYGEGRAELRMQVRPDMLNGAGWLQGGMYTALCDEAMALALFTVLGEEERIATISENTTFLQGVRGGEITSLGKVTRKTRNVAFTEGAVMRSDDGAILSKTCESFTILHKS